MVGTSSQDIRGWFDRGKAQNATHMIVVCDTYDFDDYPVFVKEGENVHDKYKEFNGPNMQKVMEVYNLSMGIEEQLAERRAFNF